MNRLLIIFCCIAFSIASCKKEEIHLYEGENSIYFPQKEEADYKAFSFGYVSGFITDSLMLIPVNATGPASDQDRPYSLKIAPESTMKEGVHFEFLGDGLFIPAGKLKDTIALNLLRHEDMLTDTLSLHFDLVPNEFFQTEMKSVEVGSGENAYERILYTMDIYVDDIAGIPPFWNPDMSPMASFFEGYLGEFSGKKFQLMIGMFDLDVEEVTKADYRPSSPSIAVSWGMAMQAYLNQMKADGNPVLEDDGSEMKMGVYAN